MKIYVNADDWGLEPIRDRAIMACFERGWITSTTAVVNREGLERATQYARQGGFFDRVGLHINLVYDRPLTDGIKRFRQFCDDTGFFNGHFNSCTAERLWLPREVKAAVAEEVRAQARVYKKQGYTMMHADSHQHSHNDISITPIIVTILKEEGFRSLRIARNMGIGMNLAKRTYKRLFNGYLRVSRLAYSDYFGSMEDFAASEALLPRNAIVEIMCHPMYTIANEEREDGVLTDFYKPFDCEMLERLKKRMECNLG